jgi:hypothetical protein
LPDLLDKTGQQSVSVQVAVVDRGLDAPGTTPHDFNGKLAHASSTDVDISDHAMSVLSILLERLDNYGILPETEVICALVKEPASPIGRKCFKHANAVELEDVLHKLQPLLSTGRLPVALNMSLGTHVGPHNGESPLEEFIRQLASPSSGQYFHTSAGNANMTGIASQRELTAGIPENLKLRTGPNACGEILVEFWWREPPGGSLSIEVEVFSATDSPLWSLPLDPTYVGSALAALPAGFNNVVCESLFHAQCHNDMSCIAFALSTKQPPGLPILNIEFTLSCPVDVVVNSWIVVSEDLLSAFLEGNNEGTVSVPGSDPEVLSVAGVRSSGQLWARSSHGPVGVYQRGTTPSTVPYVAFLASYRGDWGTSFASPRACAATANIIRDASKRTQCTTIKDLVHEILYENLNLPSGSSLSWNPRTGFGVVKL